MNKYKLRKFDIQIFAEGDTPTTPTTTAEANLTVASDIAPEISIDITTRLAENIKTLHELISLNEPIPMAKGTNIKIYKSSIKNKPTKKAGEGEIIGLTEVKREVANTIEISLNKHRKVATAELIQKVGQNSAINQTDNVVVRDIQKGIKSDFFTTLTTLTGTTTATAAAHGLQAALSAAWGKVQEVFDDTDATPIFFVSTADVATYLATASVSVQTAFGMKYIKDFLGLGDVFITPSLASGTVYGTAKENLNMAYIPSDGEVAKTFRMTADETGLVAMTHSIVTNNATIETLLLEGVVFFPEQADKVVKTVITKAS